MGTRDELLGADSPYSNAVDVEEILRRERDVINAALEVKRSQLVGHPISEYGFTPELDRAVNALIAIRKPSLRELENKVLESALQYVTGVGYDANSLQAREDGLVQFRSLANEFFAAAAALRDARRKK